MASNSVKLTGVSHLREILEASVFKWLLGFPSWNLYLFLVCALSLMEYANEYQKHFSSLFLIWMTVLRDKMSVNVSSSTKHPPDGINAI